MAWVEFSNGDAALFSGGPHQSSGRIVLPLRGPSYSQGKKSPFLQFYQWDPEFIALAIFSGPHPRSLFFVAVLWPRRVSLSLWMCRVQLMLSVSHTSPLALTSVHQRLLTVNTCNFLPEGFFP